MSQVMVVSTKIRSVMPGAIHIANRLDAPDR
jgi:hypothetical protein